MTRFPKILVALFFTGMCSHSPASSDLIPKQLKFPSTAIVHKQFNFHVIAPGVWRSSATNKRALKRMQKYGLKTVVNLKRNRMYHKREKRVADKLGIDYHHFPMNPKEAPSEDSIRSILEIISNPDNQPVLIHCQSGKDRTGLIAAIYKLEYTDSSLESIYREMLMYGYNEKKYPRIIQAIRAWSDNQVIMTAMQ